jgi:hypothetical protein
MNARSWASWSAAGLFAGTSAWALHQQAGYLFASWACARAPADIWLSGSFAVLLLLAGAVLSALAWRSAGGLADEAARPRRFLAVVALMIGALFLFALLLQMAAALFLPGCVG